MNVLSLNFLILEEKALEISNGDLQSIRVVHSLKTLELIIEASQKSLTLI